MKTYDVCLIGPKHKVVVKSARTNHGRLVAPGCTSQHRVKASSSKAAKKKAKQLFKSRGVRGALHGR